MVLSHLFNDFKFFVNFQILFVYRLNVLVKHVFHVELSFTELTNVSFGWLLDLAANIAVYGEFSSLLQAFITLSLAAKVADGFLVAGDFFATGTAIELGF